MEPDMKYVLAVAVGLLAAGARADVVDTFDNNVNQGTWRLTSNTSRLYQIEPTGGNPGAYLHGQVAAAVPTWYVSNPTANPFLGNYSATGVHSFAFDLNISGGVQVPDRVLTLHLYTTLGTGDPAQGIEAYELGTDISNYQPGWFRYMYSLNAGSTSIPQGWVVTEGNGNPGTDADWRTLVSHVENITMALGQPGYFYPNLNVWDIGLDNVTLSTVPAPAGIGAVGLAGLIGARRRR
jgi:hypothetical protein